VYSDYGDIETAAYGATDLKAATATTFAWASLNPASAWNAYDGQWLRPSYRPSQMWGITPSPSQP
jgi:hypothetical protein